MFNTFTPGHVEIYLTVFPHQTFANLARGIVHAEESSSRDEMDRMANCVHKVLK